MAEAPVKPVQRGPLRDLGVAQTKAGYSESKSRELLQELGRGKEEIIKKLRKDANVEAIANREVRTKHQSAGGRSAFAEQLADSGRTLIFQGLQGGAAAVKPTPTKTLNSVRVKTRLSMPARTSGMASAAVDPTIKWGMDGPGAAGAGVIVEGSQDVVSTVHGRTFSRELSRELSRDLTREIGRDLSRDPPSGSEAIDQKKQLHEQKKEQELQDVRQIIRGGSQHSVTLSPAVSPTLSPGGGGTDPNIWSSTGVEPGATPGVVSGAVAELKPARPTARRPPDEAKLHEAYVAPLNGLAADSASKVPGVKNLSPVHVGPVPQHPRSLTTDQSKKFGANGKTVHQRSRKGGILESTISPRDADLGSRSALSGAESSIDLDTGSDMEFMSPGLGDSSAEKKAKREKKAKKREKREKKKKKRDKQRSSAGYTTSPDNSASGGSDLEPLERKPRNRYRRSQETDDEAQKMRELERKRAQQLEDFFRTQREAKEKEKAILSPDSSPSAAAAAAAAGQASSADPGNSNSNSNGNDNSNGTNSSANSPNKPSGHSLSRSPGAGLSVNTVTHQNKTTMDGGVSAAESKLQATNPATMRVVTEPRKPDSPGHTRRHTHSAEDSKIDVEVRRSSTGRRSNSDAPKPRHARSNSECKLTPESKIETVQTASHSELGVSAALLGVELNATPMAAQSFTRSPSVQRLSLSPTLDEAATGTNHCVDM